MDLAPVRLRPAKGGPAGREREAADVALLHANFVRVQPAIDNYINYAVLGTGILPPELRDALKAAEQAGSATWMAGARILQELNVIKGRATAEAGDEGVAAALRRAEDTLHDLRDAGPGAAGKCGASYTQARADAVVQLELLRLLAAA